MTDYYDLGSYGRKVTTRAAETQLWFDRGLNWCYAYNHEEAVNCFERAASADRDCAMAYWGIAYAAGPNYNKQWKAFDPVDLERSLAIARRATAKALDLASNASAVEEAIIRPLATRYNSDNPQDVTALWNDEYCMAMRQTYRSYGGDLDVAALFAEAVMNRTPWQMWDIVIGRPADGADTLEAIDVLEKALSQEGGMRHPGLLHMYIHLMEMSPHPQRALRAGDALRNLVPDAGHLVHMPTHIDVLCGRYSNVVTGNSKAIEADGKFLERAGARNFYSLYRCHDYHFKIYGAMFLGQFAPALAAADELATMLPEDLLRVDSPPMADWLESFVPTKFHVLVRFGKWEEIIASDLPVDQDLYCVTTAMTHYAKAVAYAASGRIAEAESEAANFELALARVPPTRYLFNNTCIDILAVASEMMRGEVAYRKGHHARAFEHLRKAVHLDDHLPYDEPWGWMQPTRHALGALLLEQGQIEDAAKVYRADLGFDNTLPRACQHPDNVWSLHGYHECLVKLGRSEEAGVIRQRLDIASALADVPIKASCFCRMSVAA